MIGCINISTLKLKRPARSVIKHFAPLEDLSQFAQTHASKPEEEDSDHRHSSYAKNVALALAQLITLGCNIALKIALILIGDEPGDGLEHPRPEEPQDCLNTMSIQVRLKDHLHVKSVGRIQKESKALTSIIRRNFVSGGYASPATSNGISHPQRMAHIQSLFKKFSGKKAELINGTT